MIVLCDALAHQFTAGEKALGYDLASWLFGSPDKKKGNSSDLVLGFHCFSFDVIMAFCFAKNCDTTRVPDFKSDVVIASQKALPILTMRKHSGTLVKMMRFIPIWVGKNYGSVVTRSLFSLREVRNRSEARVVIDTIEPRCILNRLTKFYVTKAALRIRPTS